MTYKFFPVLSVNGKVSIVGELQYKEQVKTFSYAEGPKEYKL